LELENVLWRGESRHRFSGAARITDELKPGFDFQNVSPGFYLIHDA
jgi:hypothetical protein